VSRLDPSSALVFLGAVFAALRCAWRRERLVLEGGHLKRYEAKLGLLLLRQELDVQRVTALRVVPPGEGAEGHALSIQSRASELLVFRGEVDPGQLDWLASTLRARLDCEG
jgi:hypothetical protein